MKGLVGTLLLTVGLLLSQVNKTGLDGVLVGVMLGFGLLYLVMGGVRVTTGHKHWIVRVKHNGLAMRALRIKLFHTRDLPRVDASPYPYGPCDEHKDCYYLSILSVLHRWTGLTLYYDPK